MDSTQTEMADIPGGRITLRDDRLKRKWEVGIPRFQISKYPVTQKQYFSIAKASPFRFKGDRKPAESVSWYDAILFCNLISNKSGLKACYTISENGTKVEYNAGSDGYRLPSEAEWEYACRAGSNNPRYGKLEEISWYKGNSKGETQDVGVKIPNEWGLYDMLGNVWEWCWDIYDETVYGSYRVFRGGGWCDEDRGCLASNRRRSHPSFQIDDLGFRVAKSINPGG
ncbi:MAG: SUMF1/EgtB/PvdO family nonheme iron enzyme [Fibrobacteria bacterium]